jgi:hypothetical protein
MQRILFMAGIVSFGMALASQETQNNPRQVKETVVEAISSDNPAERLSAKNRLLDRRKAEISKLIEIVRSRSQTIRELTYFKPSDPLYIAVDLLGKYRAVEAAPLLVGLKAKIAHENALSPRRRESVPVIEYFFAAEALVKIGGPSLDLILMELRSPAEVSDLEVQLSAVILREGQGERMARFLLGEMRKEDLSPQALRKLEMAMQTIEKYDKRKWVFDGEKLGSDEQLMKLKGS